MSVGVHPKSAFLTSDFARRYFIYNPCTGLFMRRSTNDLCGAVRDDGYARVYIGSYPYLAHKMAWFYMFDEWVAVDHKNLQRADNKITNLRKATSSQNAMNRERPQGTSNPYRGVYPSGSKFRAQIKVNQKIIYLGTFTTAEEAHDTYLKAAKEHFGEFAYVD